MKSLLLSSMAAVVIIDLYLAEHSNIKRPEVFYAVAILMLAAALVVASHAH
jgi:hypothetical protein